MGTMEYSLFWLMQDLYHQPYAGGCAFRASLRVSGTLPKLGFIETKTLIEPKGLGFRGTL